MKYRFAVDVEAIQFSGENHQEIRDFVREHGGVEHVSYRQIGPDNPFELTAPNGFRLVVLPNEWVVALDSKLSAVSHEWFERHRVPRK